MRQPGDLGELASAQAEYEEASARLAGVAQRREDLIHQALREGRSYRDVAEVANVSKETIRRIAMARAAVIVLDGEEWQMTEPQTQHYATIGQGFATDAYPRDRELLGFRRVASWQPVAGEIARELQAVHDGKRTEPIVLDTDVRQYAFNQLTRISYTDTQTNLGKLAGALFAKFGMSVRK